MAVTQTISDSLGPDCLREVISKFGVRIKVYSALKHFLNEEVNFAYYSNSIL